MHNTTAVPSGQTFWARLLGQYQDRWSPLDRLSIDRLVGHGLPGWTTITVGDGSWIVLAPDRTAFEVIAW